MLVLFLRNSLMLFRNDGSRRSVHPANNVAWSAHSSVFFPGGIERLGLEEAETPLRCLVYDASTVC